jgi:CRISPR-associated endonuclease/helicase Cas3
MTYDQFFGAIVAPASTDAGLPVPGFAPYRYQQQLAAEPWPDMLAIPTGLGKTVAITGAWLYRRLMQDPVTPRRLVWCLPMRVLVEQTTSLVESWLARAQPLFAERGLVAPRAYVLMGGEAEDEWVDRPEDPAVLIGTQDMLLSRALMRGYGTSRYRWPVDFALLHNDALWVFDEVQLMGAGLPTSAQLEAFRRDSDTPLVVPSRTLWSSATLRPEWLDTVDFRPHRSGCRVLPLPQADRQDPRVLKRFAASKRLVQARARLASARKPDLKSFIEELCDEVVATHSGDAPTLVILNRVARAQDVFRRLRGRLDEARRPTTLLLVHARFRAAERAALNARLRELKADEDVILVATQAVEAGIDITSRHLFTELAPWSSLVQRFGRCNRGGEYGEAVVHWIDGGADTQLALPYMPDALTEARELLRTLDSASPAQLPPIVEQYATPHVLRRKDFRDLFNTEPDLSGFDIDISPYLRDPGGADVQVFWRDFAERPDDEPRPARDELCPVPIGSARDHLKALKQRPHVWNTLESLWERIIDLNDVRPGQVLMLHAGAGGYDVALGFVSGSRTRVEPVPAAVPADDRPESMSADPGAAGDFVELADHLVEARRQAAALADTLPMAGATGEVIEAALWHDVGKAHPAFQTAILEHAGVDVDRSRLWAKSPDARRPLHYGLIVDGRLQPRSHFRHELASMLGWLEAGASPGDVGGGGGHGAGEERAGHAGATGAGGDGLGGDGGGLREICDPDLVAYLIAAHHGKVRLVLRALPKETQPPDDRMYARGVWAGDALPAVSADGLRVPPLTLRLDLMQLGEGEMGPSWTARTAGLLEQWGPFRLAWLETMVRLADWRASRSAGMAPVAPDPDVLE